MHATTEQLLTLRDGGPVDAQIAAHAASCGRCSREVARLAGMRQRLRELPALAPPADGWARLSRVAPAAARPWFGWPAIVGTAAGLALGIALVLNMTQHDTVGPAPGETTDLIAATPAPASSVNGTTTAQLLATSQWLEAALQALPAAPRMMRASTALTIEELQDGIFEVDLLLGEPGLSQADERMLWQQRVRLMDALMQVRLAQLGQSH